MPERDVEAWVAEAAAGDGWDVASLPVRLCQACVRELPVDGAALSLTTAGASRTVVGASDDVARRIEEFELTVGEGPGAEAVSSNGPVLVSDIAEVADSRWPAFAGLMARTGMAATFAFPLQFGAVGLGVLILYNANAGGLGREEFANALRVADAIALLIVGSDGNSLVHDFDRRWLERSAWTRIVDQATGMLVVQLGIGVEEAFIRLRAHAFGNDRSLSEIAGDVVARRLHLLQEGG